MLIRINFISHTLLEDNNTICPFFGRYIERVREGYHSFISYLTVLFGLSFFNASINWDRFSVFDINISRPFIGNDAFRICLLGEGVFLRLNRSLLS